MKKDTVCIGKVKGWTFVVGFFVTLLIFQNCTQKVSLGPVYLYPKVEPIDIELKTFSFYPNHIGILKNKSPFTFRMRNTSKTKHNFTLIDSHRNILVSVDIMPNKSTVVTIEPPDSGNYTFYCDRFLHRYQGMEGMFMVD